MTERASSSPSPAEVASRFQALREGIATRVIGLDDVVENLLVCLLSGGHCLLTGVPGLAKTLLISTLSDLISLDFRRIQFTPDLMPADITGTEVIAEDKETGEREFRYLPGPIFANIILADEINRTPPKTQAALLEAMEEGAVTSVGERHPLDEPFFVLATQNPIEQEGTYPLPAAQLDRFMMNLSLDYPSEANEYEIVRRTISTDPPVLEPVLEADEVRGLLDTVRRTAAPDAVVAEAVRLVRATRPSLDTAPDPARRWLAWGAGPRAIHALVLGAKARALVQGRVDPTTEDVWALAWPVLRHRLIPNHRAVASQVSMDQVLGSIRDELLGVPVVESVGWLPRLIELARGVVSPREKAPA